MKTGLRWLFFTLLVVFATYWVVNLLLWYPWSYSPVLGITLMFIAITPFWVYAVYDCLTKYRGKPVTGALYISIVFGVSTIVLDFIFYGLIRNAFANLYHPATLYGYAFLVALPFIEVPVVKKYAPPNGEVLPADFFRYLIPGVASLVAIWLIVAFDIKMSESVFRFITMILASIVVFNLVLWLVIKTSGYRLKFKQILLLSFVCVVCGMLFGKYGAMLGMEWWIYYPLPMLMNVLLPPLVLKMKTRQVISYLLLSFLSAPLIHFFFSFFFSWTEYMPFLKI